jgi:beta-N-acetylhexosaminidase
MRRSLLVVVAAALLVLAPACGDDSAPTRVKGAVADRSCTTMSVEEQVAQLLVVLVPTPRAGLEVVRSGLVGGIALVGNQEATVVGEIDQLNDENPSELDLIVASDEEGGTVQRMRKVLGPIPSAAETAATLDPTAAGAAAEGYARRLAELGVTMSFGPVLDVGGGEVMGSRVFSSDPNVVSSYGTAVMEGIRRAGLTPVVKHWPGLGSGTLDTHDHLAVLDPPEVLATRDLVPFRAAFAAGAPAVMVSHGVVPGWSETPVSRSVEAITGELRGTEGFDGLVVTDALGMGAVGLPEPEAAEAAIAAGADIALLSEPAMVADTHARLVEAVSSERLSPERVREAVGHVLEIKGARPCP